VSNKSNNSGGWINDLFGGRSSSYISDKTGLKTTMSQTPKEVAENKNRGETNHYPHYTYKEKDNAWHYSNSPNAKRDESTKISQEQYNDIKDTCEGKGESMW
jgi:hypothetical protein